MKLEGKVGIVTGAAKGMGREISLELAREGLDIVAVDLAKGEMESLVAEIENMGRRVLAIEADVTSAAATENMAQKAMDVMGHIDVLVNNAGVVLAKPVTEMTETEWDKVLNVNLKGTFLCCKAVAPYMIQQTGGAIVNMSSVAGKEGNAMLSAYCSSKFGVIGLTMALSQELGPHNIRVNAVCPGFIWTAMWQDTLAPALASIYGVEEDKVWDLFIETNVPLKRPQTENDVAQCVAFLCKAENISGTTVTVDGGHTMS